MRFGYIIQPQVPLPTKLMEKVIRLLETYIQEAMEI